MSSGKWRAFCLGHIVLIALRVKLSSPYFRSSAEFLSNNKILQMSVRLLQNYEIMQPNLCDWDCNNLLFFKFSWTKALFPGSSKMPHAKKTCLCVMRKSYIGQHLANRWQIWNKIETPIIFSDNI